MRQLTRHITVERTFAVLSVTYALFALGVLQ